MAPTSLARSDSHIDGAYLTLGMILSHGSSTEPKAIFFSILGAANNLTASACEGRRESLRGDEALGGLWRGHGGPSACLSSMCACARAGAWVHLLELSHAEVVEYVDPRQRVDDPFAVTLLVGERVALHVELAQRR